MLGKNYIREDLKKMPMSHGIFWLPFMVGFFMTIPLAGLAQDEGMVMPLFWLLVALMTSLVGYLLFVFMRNKKLVGIAAAMVGVFLYGLGVFLYNYAVSIGLI